MPSSSSTIDADDPKRRSEGEWDKEDEDEEEARQQRIYIDSNAGYLRTSRTRSTELHGFIYTTEPEVDPPVDAMLPQDHQQQHPDAANTINSSDQQIVSSTSSAGSSADAGVTFQDLETGGQKATGATTRQQHEEGPDTHSSKLRELLEPLGGGPGGQQLVLSFERLSVWAPVMPKKPSVLSRAWTGAVSCGKTESNPQRQILFDVTGQVGCVFAA